MLFSCMLFNLKALRKIRYAIAGLYLCCSIAGSLYLVKNIRDAAIIMDKLSDSFKWGKQEQDILLLNLPTLYRGIGIIGAGHPSNFVYHLELLKNRKVSSRVHDVSSFNMDGRWDGAHVTVQDSTTLRVTLNQYGTWWWYGGFGAYDYENDLYKVTFVDGGFSYLLQLKKPVSSSTLILYQSGGDWKVVDPNKKEEQW